jgi:hypothetical protein
MLLAADTDPISALRAQARWERERPVPVRLWRSLSDAWLRHVEWAEAERGCATAAAGDRTRSGASV